MRRSVYCTASFSVCSRRRTELPIIYADFRLGYKLATLPSNKPKTLFIITLSVSKKHEVAQ